MYTQIALQFTGLWAFIALCIFIPARHEGLFEALIMSVGGGFFLTFLAYPAIFV